MADIVYRSPRAPLVPPGGLEAHERDMTATFSADLTLRQAQSALAAIGQWLPIDGDPDASLGALIELDSTGPLRLGYGAWRDLLLGVQFTNGRGELITAGGRTVKNVAGYDLTKFMVGQHGVFGRVVTATTRTYRTPRGALLAVHQPDATIVNRLLPTPDRPQWAMLTADGLLLGYLADEQTCEYYRRRLPATGAAEVIERSLEADITDRATRWRAGGPVAFRASVPPARIAAFITASGISGWVADAAFGIVLGSLSSSPAAGPVREAASQFGGSVRLYEVRAGGGPPDVATYDLLELSTNPVERQIIEQLKQSFDPDRKLNQLPWREEDR